MTSHLRANFVLLLLSILVCSLLYPLTLLAFGQGLFPTRALGSIIQGPKGEPVGSRLIAQEFKNDLWFHPRPSAADFNAASSSGSNFAANNPKLRDRAETILKSRASKEAIPSDAVTASGSGLDPHITLRNARSQVDRVASAWFLKTGKDAQVIRLTVEEVLNAAAFRPLAGLVGGEELINVLEVNLELQNRLQ